jgi:site-specific DNA-methyltransferase (adenine-specific)
MPEQPDESIHLIVTSPPYWQLKDYGPPDQIGFDDSYEDYINNLNLVWSECHRALHKGCRLCVVIGDQFARSAYYGRYKVIPIRTEIIRFCEAVGFDYMGAIIWQKIITCNTSGGAVIMGSYPYPRNGIIKLDYESILIFKKTGEPPPVLPLVKEQSRLTREEWNRYFTGHWHVPGEKQDKHLAVFPREIAIRLIKMFSFMGETVLDPFMGSGTTALAAKNCGRNCVGYEINEQALPVIERKMGITGLLKDSILKVTKQETRAAATRAERISGLPYVFKDPVMIRKRIDPKRKEYGSKIDAGHRRKNEFYAVKEVASPERLVLSNGMTIRLLGIRADAMQLEQAVAFLRDLTKNQRVFLKFDNFKCDREGVPLCYLYLRNKTFVNARLIRSGLADVDASLNYEKKGLLLRYAALSHIAP